jgi:spermidine synthase
MLLCGLTKDEIVAIARCLSDGVSDAYIQDVTVKKEFRGKGIGLFILSHIKTFFSKEDIMDWFNRGSRN